MTYSPSVGDQLGAAVHQNEVLSQSGLLERLFSRLFHGLVYPQIWEDPVVDMAALNIGPTDNIVCIASGGCNVMSYLTAEPASILAVDLSPAHVALGRLKLAAARCLPDYDSFYDFFGSADKPVNPRRYDAILAPRLDPDTRAYWDAGLLGRRRIDMFAHGFYRYGLLGRFLGAVHLVARLGGVDFGPLLDSKTLEEQRAFFDTKVAPLFELGLVRFLARRRASLFGLGIPPAQYDKLAADGGGDVIPVLRERVRKLMCDFPIGENYFAWQAFNRGYAPQAPRSLPPYLDPSAFETVRRHGADVRILNRSLTDVLAEEADASKQCFVLLDAQDWMTDDQLGALWTQITRTASADARVIFRTGGQADILPGRVAPALLDQWQYDAAESRRGFLADRSAIYGGFHVYRRKG
ncbi:MAG: DUF3419 family protein [Rhodobacteraceae bacterium]|nr:DUF3419 family protein [Paracoccaceae bacterium]